MYDLIEYVCTRTTIKHQRNTTKQFQAIIMSGMCHILQNGRRSLVSGMPESKLDDWTITNTFVPNWKNTYFTPATLFGACRYGVPFDNLPEEGKEMVRAYEKEYLKRCTKPGDPHRKIPDPPDDITIIT